MPPIYTDHARDQMRARGISEAEVEHVLERYDTEYPDGPRRVRVGATAGGRRIKVVADLRGPTPVIITTAERESPSPELQP